MSDVFEKDSNKKKNNQNDSHQNYNWATFIKFL